jgi:hypothetical protein
MTSDQLTAILAERIMGWNVSPNRFLTGGRQWLSRWQFRPTENIGHAFQLLEQAAPTRYSMRGDDSGAFCAQVQIGGIIGDSCDRSKARALTYAIARALGLEVGERSSGDSRGTP